MRGTADLRIETGRWRGLRREDRVCTICCDGEIEDTEHLILRCKVAGEERKNVLEEMKKLDGDLQDKSKKEQLAAILEEPQTCLLYTSPSPRDRQKSRMPSSA